MIGAVRMMLVRVARLGPDIRGAALIEFAFTVPVLLLLFVGGFQISDAIFAYRKVTATTRTIADLTTQQTKLTDADIDKILNASQQVLTPYKLSATRMRVSQVSIDNSGNPTVDWSRGKNMPGMSPGSPFYVPPTFKRNQTTIVVSEVFYNYVPGFASSMIGTLAMKDRIDMNPRKSVKIDRTP
jgi:Flp pilus assembly protein TadG